MEWREEIVDNLFRTGREELWGQAVRILLSSWPRPSPPFNLRFERAGQVTALLPRRLVLAAFDGLRRDAFEAPNEVVEAATALVHIIPIDSLTDDERRRIASAYIGLLALALRQEQCENTLGSWFEVALAALPACVASHDVDAFCKEVHERDPTAVARALRARVLGLPLQRIGTLDRDYPLLVEAAGKRGAWGLLWTLALDRDPAVRFVAQVMIAGAPDTPTSSVVDEMDFRLKQIFVHELLGVAQADGKRAIALLRALYRQEDDQEFWARIFTRMVDAFPGALRELLKGTSNLSEDLLDKLRSLVEARQEAFERLKSLPELDDLAPCWREGERWKRRLTEDAMAQAQASSVLMFLATKQPIVCGSGTLSADGSVSTFSRFEHSFEGNAIETADPLGAHVVREVHRKAAQDLIEAAP